MSAIVNKVRLSIILVMKSAGCSQAQAASMLADAIETGKLGTGEAIADAATVALCRKIAQGTA